MSRRVNRKLGTSKRRPQEQITALTWLFAPLSNGNIGRTSAPSKILQRAWAGNPTCLLRRLTDRETRTQQNPQERNLRPAEVHLIWCDPVACRPVCRPLCRHPHPLWSSSQVVSVHGVRSHSPRRYSSNQAGRVEIRLARWCLRRHRDRRLVSSLQLRVSGPPPPRLLVPHQLGQSRQAQAWAGLPVRRA
jgi:hypothetical protein